MSSCLRSELDGSERSPFLHPAARHSSLAVPTKGRRWAYVGPMPPLRAGTCSSAGGGTSIQAGKRICHVGYLVTTKSWPSLRRRTASTMSPSSSSTTSTRFSLWSKISETGGRGCIQLEAATKRLGFHGEWLAYNTEREAPFGHVGRVGLDSLTQAAARSIDRGRIERCRALARPALTSTVLQIVSFPLFIFLGNFLG